MSVAFAVPHDPRQNGSPVQHAQEQARLTAAVDDGVDADALQHYLLMKIQCAGARPTSRAQIHEAITDLLQSPTPAGTNPAPPQELSSRVDLTQSASASVDDFAGSARSLFFGRRSSSSRTVLSVLNAVLAPRKLLQKRKRDTSTSPPVEDDSPVPVDKRRKVLGAGAPPRSPRTEDARRGLLFGLSRSGTRRIAHDADVFGPDASKSPRLTTSRSVSSWRLRLEHERRGVFSPSSGGGGASPLIGSLMSLVLSPQPEQLPSGSPARLALSVEKKLKTPYSSLAAFRFPVVTPANRMQQQQPLQPLSEVRLPDMAFSPDGLRLSADSLFGLYSSSTPSLPMQFPPSPSLLSDEDLEEPTMRASGSIPFPTTSSPSPSPRVQVEMPSLPRFAFACSPGAIRFFMHGDRNRDVELEMDDGYLHDDFPASPSSHLRPSPVARPTNPTPTAASSSSMSLYDDEQPGLGYTFSTEAGSPSMPLRLSTASQDVRYALLSEWDDPLPGPMLDALRVRSASDARRVDAAMEADAHNWNGAEESPDPDGMFERNSSTAKDKSVVAPRRWRALELAFRR
ncbi:hypothetical protein EXIGLDRAFT_722095 [Exidia glandulosa HHB12029]|uniref:Uncharacterized protein n=1 Tax=Exidia glandulosa HHB12029 TaxID=1314781 RepID=A0A165FFN4_EXIGL|nr:hypothetical protein EXIGLDRAFT_722095 [Exidia glandulosa HHB12029]